MDAEVVGGGPARRRLWTTDEKRRIVEQTLSSDLSVAVVARQHGVNANQVFYWRKLYRAERSGGATRCWLVISMKYPRSNHGICLPFLERPRSTAFH